MDPARPAGTQPADPALVLVADDKPENLLLLTSFLKREGYAYVTAANGREAVEACRRRAPDIILMDAAMPDMDGFQATHAIRRLFPDRWIPIIFVSAHSSTENQARGLSAGADDYISKPVNLAVLAEKLRAMQRIAAMQARIAQYAAQLEESLERSRSDQEFARHLLTHMAGRMAPREELGLAYWAEAAAGLSGDIVAGTHGPAGKRYLMVADAAGHGLAAAISVLPLVEAFYRLAKKGFSPASIISELNAKARGLLPRDRFVAALIVVADEAENSLQVWNGGLPEALFLDDAGEVLRRFPSRHPPLGMLSMEQLKLLPELFAWPGPGQLVIYTDGLSEAEDRTGEPFGAARLEAVLRRASRAERLDAVRAAVLAHLGATSPHDDVTLAMLDCPAPRSPSPLPVAGKQPSAGTPATSWRSTLRLDARQLRTLDVVPLVMNWIEQLQPLQERRGLVFTVLAELVSNAIDHGLLGLDSGLKHIPDGFERYMEARTEALARLTEGWIEITVECAGGEDTMELTITVTDSGSGFPYADYLDHLQGSDTLPSGRGIAPVRQLTTELRYEGRGNRVVARLSCPSCP